MINDRQSLRVWDASECVLMFIDYQAHVLDVIFAQDRRVIELNTRTLAKMAVAFKIPVILSTVGVEMGANGPTIDSLQTLKPFVFLDHFDLLGAAGGTELHPHSGIATCRQNRNSGSRRTSIYLPIECRMTAPRVS